ncbi:MAG: hypothetical protein KGZ25_12760 [Planctomycetes bacterium]|nr:hypothetical protein [Planctomycetota bacterium]
MRFEKALEAIPTKNALKRTASAHVRDYQHLNEQRLRESICDTKNQYTHPETVKKALNEVFYVNDDLSHRVLAWIILHDVLLNEYGHLLEFEELSEEVQQKEQQIVKAADEKTLRELAGDKESSVRYKNLSLYQFVLETAWEHRETKSVDEANLLRKLRERLQITEREHRILEAKLGKYPKSDNRLHTRDEITDTVRLLESKGLLFEVRDDDGIDFVVIPEEIADKIKEALNVEIRRPGYEQLLEYKAVRNKSYLKNVLKNAGVPYPTRTTLTELQSRVMETVRPSVVLGGDSPRGGLNSQDLAEWCADLGLNVAGLKDDRIDRIIKHYDQLELHGVEEGDEREVWYHYFTELGSRDTDILRKQHIIERDSEMDGYFEDATTYLFETKLNLSPLRQAGTEHSDGLLSFEDKWVMWDNKSSASPIRLKDFLRQFDSYMDRAEKDVPVFLVVAPSFTPESDTTALRYTAEHIGRNIVLIEAGELKELADLWSSEDNKNRSQPFPLGMLARPGRFNLESVRASI